MQSPELVQTLQAGALLIGSAHSDGLPDLKSVLVSRLSQYHTFLGQDVVFGEESLEDIQLKTAQQSLSIVAQVQNVLSKPPEASTSAATTAQQLLGTRDLAQVRTLLSIVFKWAAEPLLTRVTAAIPNVTPGSRNRTTVNIIDLTSVPDDYKMLSSLISRLMGIILPFGIQGSLTQTIVTSIILDRHLGDLLRPCIVLGWLPKSLASESVPPLDELRPLVVHMITMLPVSQCITALSGILSEKYTLVYVRKTCSYLLSRQLLRRDGVRGMFAALFSEEDLTGDDAPLGKLQNVGKLLQSIPTGIQEVQYFGNVVPQLLAILSTDSDTTLAHTRAASFALSRLLAEDGNPHHAIVSRMVLPIFQRPFLYVTPETVDKGETPPEMRKSSQNMTPGQVIIILQTLLTNTDPSPAFISSLLTPIIPPLYSLLAKLEEIKTSDPAMRTTLRGFLGTWGRLLGATECAATLWLLVNGEGGEWRVDIAGEISRIEDAVDDVAPLSLFTPEELERAEEAGEFDINANILNLRPDPAHFITFLRTLDRPDIVSQLFVGLLEGYRETKTRPDSDPLRTLLYLQLIMQIQLQLSSGESSFNILKQPDHILSFIKHALDTATTKPTRQPEPSQRKGLNLDDLRIVEEIEDDESESNDSDDEEDSSNPSSGDEEMTSTALNLLLSILEANPDLSAQTDLILDDVFSSLEVLARDSSEAIKPLAREARMVLTARLASSSAPSSSRPKGNVHQETPQDTYQKALKLLQDPLLPVRAHGLLLLRELVTARPSKSGVMQEPAIDRALVPGILSIFLQALQDDDSYIFLNAVQGLAAIVNGFGKDTLRGLVDMYVKGLDGIAGSAMIQQDVDVRTRVGEALGQVIKRCGDTLPSYAYILIPPLFAVVRTSHLPTALRTSSLSLLAQCVSANALSVIPYATDMTTAMVDLLQIETVPASRSSAKTTAPASGLETEEKEDDKETEAPKRDTMTFQPTTTNSKIPTLRRAALHFLTLLLRAFTEQVEESSTAAVYALPGEVMRRAKTIIGYVAITDEDAIVRVMAKEGLDALDGLAIAMLGL